MDLGCCYIIASNLCYPIICRLSIKAKQQVLVFFFKKKTEATRALVASSFLLSFASNLILVRLACPAMVADPRDAACRLFGLNRCEAPQQRRGVPLAVAELA